MTVRNFTLPVVGAALYLDDSNASYAPADPALPALAHQYPRTAQHELLSTTNPAATSKYDYLNVAGNSFPQAETAWNAAFSAGLNMIICRHISGHEFQGYTQTTDSFCSKGVGFKTTGPTTIWNPAADVAQIYAGHWLYEAGTLLNGAIGAAASGATGTVTVDDATRFVDTEYACIYDAPAGSFVNAEHVRIVSRAGNVLTVERGYKSTANAHADNSIIAQHVLGQGSPTGTDPRLWTFNFSTQCPVDGNGKKWNDVYASFLATYFNKYKAGQATTARILGIQLDTDFYFEFGQINSDTNNDLVTDLGRDGAGTNWTGDGLDVFYQLCSERMPTAHLVAGIHDARGFDWYNGVQEEVAWDFGNGDFTWPPAYKELNSMFAMYLYNTGARSRGPALVQCLSKTPTLLYPQATNPLTATPTMHNRPARLGLALTLMEQGYYGTHSLYEPDAWYEEMAVNRTSGAAIAKTDLAGIYANKGWLGQPTGPFKRIFDPANFTSDKSLLANGTFETNVTGWTGTQVTLSRNTAEKMSGTASMLVSAHTNYQATVSNARVSSAAVTLKAGEGYTICFSAKSTKRREMTIAFGSETAQRVFLSAGWRRYVMGFRQSGTASITGISKAAQAVVTAPAHGYTNGDTVEISGVVGMTQVNGLQFTVANKTTNTFELTGINSTGYGTYTSGGVANRISQSSLVFQVGRENSQIWLDDVFVFPGGAGYNGNCNVFRRDFTYGIALANATPDPRLVDLGGTFRKILGTQDPSINDGSTVTSVTLAPYDGLVLLR